MNHMNTHEQDYLRWYKRLHHPGTPFDPTLLVELTRAQLPQWPGIADAMARCTRTWVRSELYTSFSGPLDKRERRFFSSYFLDHPTLGTLTVDVFRSATAPEDFIIGGFEHLDRVLGRRTSAAEMLEMGRRARACHAKQFPSN
ncbi:MAG: hypothetical protein IPN38_13540 [Flavobacteriales bacterium]|nr:hypothetical protein [Flavobacteriales bacterium]